MLLVGSRNLVKMLSLAGATSRGAVKTPEMPETRELPETLVETTVFTF